MVRLASDMTRLQQQFRPGNTSATTMFTAPSLMFTVATAGCESYAANDATLAGSELDVQSRVVQHGCVGVKGPRNG